MNTAWGKLAIGIISGVVVAVMFLAFQAQSTTYTVSRVPPIMAAQPVLKTDVGTLLEGRYRDCDRERIMCGNDHSWDTLSMHTAQLNFDRKMNFRSYECKQTKRFGKPGDGGYELCLDPPFAFKRGSCIIYSFGINNEWSFDDAVNRDLGCDVHSFDPSMGKPDHMHKPNMFFHNLGIWGKDYVNSQGWKLERFSTIRKRLGHENKTIDAMKIDVEAAEWPTLRDMILNGDFNSIKQIILEIHTPKFLKRDKPMTIQEYAEIFNYYHSLELLGFKLFLMHNRNGCCLRFHQLVSSKARLDKGPTLCCYETFLVNSRYLPT